nr:PREDICTED: LOW QUALITY PROTEIN: protein-glutamate O-methyltransferase [Tribolium castaneum]|eukprot:XP_015833761.1 PREDICTED: LOW QUALITY PROTEIN: protein-glutamate O-methyltransferase [Tribolium castaneum]
MCDCSPQSMDLKTPRNVYLTAFYKRSFAHHTVKNRMPVILTQVIDGLARNKEEIANAHGEEGQNDLKSVIGELSKLKYEIQTNKSLRKIVSDAPDVKFYNDYITGQSDKDGNVTFFSVIWLLSECYMYRRIREAFEVTNTLKNYDPFLKQKRDSHFQALPVMAKLAQYLIEVLEKSDEPKKEDFIHLLKINLWGNKCDLSLSNGEMTSNTDDLFNLESLEPNILCDHSEKYGWRVSGAQSSAIIDIVLDNSGYELFTDLCIADYLTTKKLASKIRFYVKTIPWFISDVMATDFRWTIDHLRMNVDEYLRQVGIKWFNYVANGTWVVIEDNFWTLPVDFSYMRDVKPELYKELAKATLVIFKGDLNYRKLFGEKNWDPTTPIDEALQNFNPTKLCTLRTIKADIVCGLPQGLAEKMEAITEKWMETGDYGLIQFSEKIVSV